MKKREEKAAKKEPEKRNEKQNILDPSFSHDSSFSLPLHSDRPTCHDTASLLSVLDASDMRSIFQYNEDSEEEGNLQPIDVKELSNSEQSSYQQLGSTREGKRIHEKEITESNFLRPRRPITTGNLERKREIRL